MKTAGRILWCFSLQGDESKLVMQVELSGFIVLDLWYWGLKWCWRTVFAVPGTQFNLIFNRSKLCLLSLHVTEISYITQSCPATTFSRQLIDTGKIVRVCPVAYVCAGRPRLGISRGLLLYAIGVAMILSGVHYSSKNVLKLTFSTWGALTNVPCKLRLKILSALGMQVHPLHPLATPVICRVEWRYRTVQRTICRSHVYNYNWCS